MTKEQYQREMQDIQILRSEILLREKSVREIYVKANKRFEIGDLVVTQHGDNGFITKADADSSGNIYYEALKQKKDGTASKHSLYVWNWDSVKLA